MILTETEIQELEDAFSEESESESNLLTLLANLPYDNSVIVLSDPLKC